MASIRDLKKDLKYAFGDLVEQVLLFKVINETSKEDTDALINEIYAAYEEALQKVNAHRKQKDKKAYFKKINAEIDQTLDQLAGKVNALFQ